MQDQLDSIKSQLAHLTAAAEYRHQLELWHLQIIHAKLDHQTTHSQGWLKVPLALALPVAVFLLMWAITGDARRALSAAKLAG